MKLFCSIFFISLVFTSYAQNKKLKGKFIGENLEKSFINVINVNTYKATISQLGGKFEIEAEVGDSILISSIQYKEMKFVVKPEFFNNSIEIPLKLKVNELDQVNLFSINLTGNLESDAKNIKLNKSSKLDFGTFDVSKAYDEEVTTQAEFSLRNVAMEQNPIPASVNFRRVFKLISGLFTKRDQYKNGTDNKSSLIGKLGGKDFFIDFLNIKENQIGQFISYAKGNGLTNELFKQSNDLDLIQFLMEISEDFKAEYGK